MFMHCQLVSTTHPTQALETASGSSSSHVAVNRISDHTTLGCGQHYSKPRTEINDGESWRRLRSRRSMIVDVATSWRFIVIVNDNDCFIANFLLNVPVKEFLKLINI